MQASASNASDDSDDEQVRELDPQEVRAEMQVEPLDNQQQSETRYVFPVRKALLAGFLLLLGVVITITGAAKQSLRKSS